MSSVDSNEDHYVIRKLLASILNIQLEPKSPYIYLVEFIGFFFCNVAYSTCAVPSKIFQTYKTVLFAV
jgi:hypothetical protein